MKVLLVESLEPHVHAASLAVFPSLAFSLAPERTEHAETLLLVHIQGEFLGPLQRVHEVHETVEGDDKFFHVVHQFPVNVLMFILSIRFVLVLIVGHARTMS